MSEQPNPLYPTLPEAPEVPRRVHLPGTQIAGMLLLLILPILAALGAFGESFDTAEASGPDISLSATYPSRLRYRLNSSLQLTIQNTGQQTIDALEVHVERDYLDEFSNLTFTPSVTEATTSAYLVELHDLAPGAGRVIRVELQGEQYGRHSGRVWITIGDRTAAEVELSSIVYP